MSAIHVARSFAYGFKLCLYWVAVVLVGGGGIALGSALAWPEIQSWRSNSAVSTPELAGGAVLAILGVVVLVSGMFGILYKLLGDSVAEGRAAGSETHPADDTRAAPADANGGGSPATIPDSESGEHAGTADSSQPTAATQAGDHEETDVPAETQIDTVERRSVDTGSSQPAAGTADGQSTEAPSADDDSWDGEWEEGTKATEQHEPPQEEDLSATDPTTADSTTAPDNREPRSRESTPDESVESKSQTEQPQPSAEEIAFGSTGGIEGEPSTRGNSPSAGEIEDEPPVDEREDEMVSTGEPEDEPVSTGEPDGERKSTETAGSPSSDPLADRLGDDEN